MPEVRCPIDGCIYSTPDLDPVIVAALLATHTTTHNAASSPATGALKVERVKRPTITSAGTTSDWQYFQTRWEEYVAATKVTGKDKVLQLLECCDEALRKDLTRSNVGLSNKTEREVLLAIKALAVRDENVMVSRVALNDMRQDREETIRSFCARLRGQASVCQYTIQCPNCEHDVDYTEPILRDALCRGIEDTEIQLNLLGHTNQDMSLNEVVHFVEAKEAGKRSANKLLENQATGNAIRSSYRKNRSSIPTKPSDHDQNSHLCSYCGKKGHGERQSAQKRKNTCPAYNHQCSHCSRLHHFEDVCRSKDKPKPKDENPPNHQGAIYQALCSATVSSISADHHIYQKEGNRWSKQPSSPQPFIKLSVRVDDQDYVDLGFKPIVNNPENTITVPAMTDTGCQSCLAGFKTVQRLGLTKSDLLSVKMKMHAANNQPISILGAIILRISGTDQNDNVKETRQMTYITKDSNNIFLSKAACIDLGMISKDFPTIRATPSTANPIADNRQSCDCPRRELPPPLPTKLPFPATTENREKLQGYLLDYYKSSTFNTCEHQPLPLMSGPPLKLRIDSDAEPVAHHSPIPVPVHWQDKVKADLDRDVRLGVIEPVPVGEPITWCHRMVVCSKKNGEPRRTVDLSASQCPCYSRDPSHPISVPSSSHCARRGKEDSFRRVERIP